MNYVMDGFSPLYKGMKYGDFIQLRQIMNSSGIHAFETCSIVGSSSLLTKRSHGKNIDESDFVIRIIILMIGFQLPEGFNLKFKPPHALNLIA